MENEAPGSESGGIGLLITLVIILIGSTVFYKDGLTTDQFVEIIRIIIWPLVALAALSNDGVTALIGGISDFELPWGIKASTRARQQETEPASPVTEAGTEDLENEESEFKELDGFLVKNTINALFWFEQNHPATQDAFTRIYSLTDAVTDDVSREKLVILGVLLQKGLIEIVRNKTVEVSAKGKRYLRHLSLIP